MDSMRGQGGNQNRHAAGTVLQGLRVVDLSMGWAGPLTAMLLADFGAEVIKIESTRHLDWWRGDVLGQATEDRPYEQSAHFNGVNRNKYDMALDLGDARGMALLKRLIAISDVMVENFTPRVMENFGLTYDVVRTINPSLIMISMPAFGGSGPWRDYGGFGNTIDPLSGVAGLTGYPDGSPILASNAYGDPVAGVGGAIGLLMALVHRSRTGLGQHIELSHQELVVHHVAYSLLDYAMNGRNHGRRGNRHPWMAPHGIYPCIGEEQWIAIAVASDEEWRALCATMDHLEAATDERFADGPGRWHYQDELDDLLATWTAKWRKEELAERLQQAGISAEPVNSSEEVIEDSQIRALGSFVWMDRKYVGHHPYPGVTARLTATPGAIYMPAPVLGEHNSFVLAELLGVAKAELEVLSQDGIIGSEAESA